MSKVFLSNQIKQAPIAAGQGNADFTVVARAVTTENLAANHVFEMAVIPPYHTVVDAKLITGDLDTGAAITLSVGAMIGTVGDQVFANRTTANAIGEQFIAASNVGQAGGVARANVAAGFLLAPSAYAQSVGVQVKTAPAGSAPAGAQIVLHLTLRHASIL